MKYRPFDPSPEAVAWRKENKKRVRPLVRKKKNRNWILWVGVVILCFASLPLGLVLACVVAYVTASDRR